MGVRKPDFKTVSSLTAMFWAHFPITQQVYIDYKYFYFGVTKELTRDVLNRGRKFITGCLKYASATFMKREIKNLSILFYNCADFIMENEVAF